MQSMSLGSFTLGAFSLNTLAGAAVELTPIFLPMINVGDSYLGGDPVADGLQWGPLRIFNRIPGWDKVQRKAKPARTAKAKTKTGWQLGPVKPEVKRPAAIDVELLAGNVAFGMAAGGNDLACESLRRDTSLDANAAVMPARVAAGRMVAVDQRRNRRDSLLLLRAALIGGGV